MARVEDANSVDSERQTIKAQVIQVSTETRYYISSLNSVRVGTADSSYWGVENKVHYVRDVTQERTKSNSHDTFGTNSAEFCLELVSSGFENMAQANGYVLWFGETQGSI